MDLKKQLAHPKAAQPKMGAYSAPSLLLVSIPHLTRMPDNPAKRPGKYASTSDGLVSYSGYWLMVVVGLTALCRDAVNDRCTQFLIVTF